MSHKKVPPEQWRQQWRHQKWQRLRWRGNPVVINIVSLDTTHSYNSASSPCSSHSGTFKINWLCFLTPGTKTMYTCKYLHLLLWIDKSRHDSRHSASSGFHSYEFGIEHHSDLLKPLKNRKKKSLKRRCHDNSKKSENSRTFDTNIPSHVAMDTMRYIT